MNGIFQSAFCVLALAIAGQPSLAQPIPFDSNRWTVEAAQHSIQEYEGRQSLFLLGGFAYLNDVEATDGTMEFDIAFGPERGFVGAVWRMLDYENHEEFYIRPHQSGNPDANQAQVKKLEFGYSDRARVYLNCRLIYKGNNSYRSRDYRYLGSIGFFDVLHLQFDAGRNELWIAVGESFGGWGLRARFTEPDGLRIGD